MQRSAFSRPTAGARFIDPRVLARIDNLELIARTVVEGFINGLHRSPFLGLSLDFAEHRPYMPGDDLRRIDWRLLGRTDRYYVKQFEADTNTNFTVLLDVSRSMAYGAGGVVSAADGGGGGGGRGPGRDGGANAQAGLSKLDYARYLAACLLYFANRQRDRVGLVTFDDDIVEHVPPSARHLEVVLHALDRAEPGVQGSLARPLLRIAEFFQRRCLLVLISDLYEEPEAVLDAVSKLRYKGNDVIVFHVFDPTELDFPFTDPVNFQDLETGERIPVVPAQLRERYRELVRAHVGALSRLLTENRIDYALFNTATPLDHALFAYLSARQRLTRVR